jgi:hypothetical protein
MTMPHLMNCDHSEEGWCLGCVKKQWEELWKEREIRDYLARGAGIVCHRCPAKNECEVAFDGYNVDVEPLIDCLGAK